MIAMRRCYAISIIGMEGKNMNHNKKKILKVTALFVFMFFLGWGAGSLQKQQMKKTVETVSVQNQADNWGLGFGAEGTQPTGNVTADELKKYNAWYVGDKSKNVIYLTFDCGYENGNTEPVLDALKKHNAKATFFVVGHFLESAPDIVKRIEAEGHAVGNHTYHHPDMSSISDMTSFQKEMDDVASLYQTVTGKEMIKYYRPPQGKYSTKNLEMAKELKDLDYQDECRSLCRYCLDFFESLGLDSDEIEALNEAQSFFDQQDSQENQQLEGVKRWVDEMMSNYQNGDTGMYDQMKSTMENLGIDEEKLKNMSKEEVDQYVQDMCKKFGISQSLFDKLKDKFGR